MAQSTALRESSSGSKPNSTSTSTVFYPNEPRLRVTPSQAGLASLNELIYITDSILTTHTEDHEHGHKVKVGTDLDADLEEAGSDESESESDTEDWGCDCSSGCGVTDGDTCECVSSFGNFYTAPASSSTDVPGVLNLDALPDKLPLVECGPACACGKSCSNRVTQRGLRVSIHVRPSSSNAVGLGAYYSPPDDQTLGRGTFICLYTGEYLSIPEANNRWSTSQTEYREGEGNYILTLRLPGQRIHIDPRNKGNVGRFFNHSCDPSCVVHVVRWGGDSIWPRAAIFAKRDILPGEELTYDYANASGSGSDNQPSRDVEGDGKGLTRCLCGAASCRGWMPFDPDV